MSGTGKDVSAPGASMAQKFAASSPVPPDAARAVPQSAKMNGTGQAPANAEGAHTSLASTSVSPACSRTGSSACSNAMATSDSLGPPAEDHCAVCGQEESFDDDLILFCDSCNIGVHETCYAVRRVPKGEWLCDPCAAGLDPQALACPACPNRGGALKRTRKGLWGGWSHVVCTVFLPETGFLQPETLGDAAGFDLIPEARKRLKCSICADAKLKASGSKVQCHHGKCTKAFHVTCAMKRRLVLELSDEGNFVFCDAHAPGKLASQELDRKRQATKGRKKRRSRS